MTRLLNQRIGHSPTSSGGWRFRCGGSQTKGRGRLTSPFSRGRNEPTRSCCGMWACLLIGAACVGINLMLMQYESQVQLHDVTTTSATSGSRSTALAPAAKEATTTLTATTPRATTALTVAAEPATTAPVNSQTAVAPEVALNKGTNIFGNPCAKHTGYIIVNLNGRLANNLFQIFMANRLSEDLCWPVIVRANWIGFVNADPKAAQCFPGLLQHEKASSSEPTPQDLELFDTLQIAKATDNRWISWNLFAFGVKSSDNNELYLSWSKQSVEAGKSIDVPNKIELNHSFRWMTELVANLKNPPLASKYETVRAVHLSGFYYNYQWMAQEEWLPRVREWGKMDTTEKCCQHINDQSYMDSKVVVMHVRNFSEQWLDTKFQPNVYIELLDKFYFNNPNDPDSSTYELWIVCQPQDINIPLIEQLTTKYAGRVKVVPGNDPFDALCILRMAKRLILSTNSAFSQVAAILSPWAAKEGGVRQQVHYLLEKLDRNQITLLVPTWNYHLVASTKASIETFQVPFASIKPFEAASL